MSDTHTHDALDATFKPEKRLKQAASMNLAAGQLSVV